MATMASAATATASTATAAAALSNDPRFATFFARTAELALLVESSAAAAAAAVAATRGGQTASAPPCELQTLRELAQRWGGLRSFLPAFFPGLPYFAANTWLAAPPTAPAAACMPPLPSPVPPAPVADAADNLGSPTASPGVTADTITDAATGVSYPVFTPGDIVAARSVLATVLFALEELAVTKDFVDPDPGPDSATAAGGSGQVHRRPTWLPDGRIDPAYPLSDRHRRALLFLGYDRGGWTVRDTVDASRFVVIFGPPSTTSPSDDPVPPTALSAEPLTAEQMCKVLTAVASHLYMFLGEMYTAAEQSKVPGFGSPDYPRTFGDIAGPYVSEKKVWAVGHLFRVADGSIFTN